PRRAGPSWRPTRARATRPPTRTTTRTATATRTRPGTRTTTRTADDEGRPQGRHRQLPFRRAVLLRLRVHRGRDDDRPGVDRRGRGGRARVLRGLHRVRPRAGRAVGPRQRAAEAAVTGRPGVAVARPAAHRAPGVPHLGARGGGAVGLDRGLRPRGALPAVGCHARAAPGAAPVHARAAAAVGGGG